METKKYKELMHNNVTKDYKKTDEKVIDDIKHNDKKVAIKLEVADRMYCTSNRDSILTIKDHRQNYMINSKCREV